MSLVKLLVSTALALVSAVAFAAVDVNKASQADLQTVKGIGPAMSTRILDARKSGSFKDWTDLQTRVKGVGTGNSAKFSAEGLTVDGAALTATAATAATAATTMAAAPTRPTKTSKSANTATPAKAEVMKK